MSPRARRTAPYLLDVNVLIALAWPNHVHHAAAREWFAAHHVAGWATTPITEVGFVRISSNRVVVPTPTDPSTAIAMLDRLTTSTSGHQFWSDDVRAVIGDADPARLTSHRHVTDAHLASLAVRHGGSLATFDAALPTRVADGSGVLVIPA